MDEPDFKTAHGHYRAVLTAICGPSLEGIARSRGRYPACYPRGGGFKWSRFRGSKYRVPLGAME